MQIFSTLLAVVAIIALPVAVWQEFGKPSVPWRRALAIAAFAALLIWQMHRMGPEWLVAPAYAAVVICLPIAVLRRTHSRVTHCTQEQAVTRLTRLIRQVTDDEASLYVSSRGYVGIGSFQLKPNNRYFAVAGACPYCTVEAVLEELGIDSLEYGDYTRQGQGKQAVLRKQGKSYRLTFTDSVAGAVFFRPTGCAVHAS